MDKTALVRRWKPLVSDRSKLASLRFDPGSEEARSPFGRFGGRVDFRGLDVSGMERLSECVLHSGDLSFARMASLWIEGCHFEDVLFSSADLRNVADHGNRFIRCRFEDTRLDAAILGYQGSRYEKCSFVGATFKAAGGIRAEFDGCEFINCRLNGMEFNASSFVDCRFVGNLTEVWFRGGFALPEQEKQFGRPRPNEMKGVDFSEATLESAAFTDGCRLASVLLPKDGNHVLILDLKSAVERAREYYVAQVPTELKADVLRYTQSDFMTRTPLPQVNALRKKLDALPPGVLDICAAVAGMAAHSKTQDHWIINRKDFAQLRPEYADGLWRALTGRS